MRVVKPAKLRWQKTRGGYFRKKLMHARNRAGKAARVQLIRILPRGTIRPHYHKGQMECEYVLAGSGVVRSGKQTIRLKPGAIFTVAPNELHEIVKTGKKGLLLLVTKANYSDDTEWLE